MKQKGKKMKIDYVVLNDSEPEIVETLEEARTLAKELSLTNDDVTIQKYVYDKKYDEMVWDDSFVEVYRDGVLKTDKWFTTKA